MPPSADLPVSLGDAYRLIRELGGGGMSRVFEAEEVALGRRVAAKVLPPDLAERVSRDRFRREVQLAASLQHPTIVPLLAAGEADGVLFYTMPMVEGQSLRARLDSGELLVPRDLVRVLLDIAEALAYAHDRGVVHRDIKPDNVLLAGGNRAMVVDFGVAKAISSAAEQGGGAGPALTMAGVALGTPAYMAPEQAAADPSADHRVDIYAFGALAYELLGGRPLFAGRSMASVLAAQVTERPEPLVRRPEVPEALYAVVDRCLQKDPDERFANARALADALTAVQAEVTLGGVSTGGVRAAAPRRTRWWPAAVAVVLVLVGGVVARSAGLFDRGLVDGRTLRERDAILVAQFADGGSGLGAVVSDALRTDLSQSPLVQVVQPTSTRDALQRMQREPGTLIDSTLAYELAVREGIPAVLTGEVVPVGRGFQLTARLVRADSGLVLAAVRESAADSGGVIGAIDRLSKQLRGKLGESLRTLGQAPALERVTTGSLEALRLYTEGSYALEFADDYPRGMRLLEQAIARDSTFAMALRKLATALGNRRMDPERQRALLEQAMRHRDRLTPFEAAFLAGSYHARQGPTRDLDKAIEAYEQALSLQRDESRVLNNLSLLYMERGQLARAESLMVRGLDEADPVLLGNLIELQLRARKVAAADSTVALLATRFPGYSTLPIARAQVRYAQGEVVEAMSRLETFRDSEPPGGMTRSNADALLAGLAIARGRVREGTATYDRLLREGGAMIAPQMRMQAELGNIVTRAWFGMADLPADRRQLDALAAELRRAATTDADAAQLLAFAAGAYALLGDGRTAERTLAEAERQIGVPNAETAVTLAYSQALVASLIGQHDRALALVREFPEAPGCPECLAAPAAWVYERANLPDSAAVRWRQFLASRRLGRVQEDAWYTGLALRSLGDYHAGRGDRDEAAAYYAQFLELYDRPDPALVAERDEVRRRLERLRPG